MKWRELCRRTRFLILPLALLTAAATGAVVTDTVAADPAAASAPLRTHADARGVQIGTAVANGPLGSDAPYRTVLNREFNQVTPENEMKWDATEPNPGQFNFGGADAIVNSATANGQVIRGHTFVWHSQAPGWLQGLPADELRAAMQRHINTVGGRYAGRIYAWDVVNEAFNEDGSMRNSFWLQRLGPGYIAEAFRLARQADPSAKLYINDFNVEGVNAKSNAMFNLVRDLRAQGVPIDGVGLQGHLALQFGFPNDIQQNIQRFADLGVEVAITELDVRMQLPADATKLANQATAYANVVRACLAVSACVGVTVWGFTDRYSWVPGTFPGEGAACLYDENFNAKPAYEAVHNVLASGFARDKRHAAWRPDRR
jgi:endo-1,4-beta-xylanase